MKRLFIGAALAAFALTVPALAADKKASSLKNQESSAQENANREKNDDGTFQGKPVVQGPANWNDSASTGSSSGEAGAEKPDSTK